MQPAPPSTYADGPQWNALHAFSVLMKIFAWIVGVVGIIVFFIAFANAANASNSFFGAANAGPLFISAWTSLFSAIIGFISLYVGGELIMLLITIEKNTRKP